MNINVLLLHCLTFFFYLANDINKLLAGKDQKTGIVPGYWDDISSWGPAGWAPWLWQDLSCQGK